MFLNFVGELCSISDNCLETLYLGCTGSTAEDGAQLWQTIADSTIDSLKQLTMYLESAWFSEGREECLMPLVTVLTRQNALETLDMEANELTVSQMQ